MTFIWNYRAQLVIVLVFAASLHVPHQLRDVLRAVAIEPALNSSQIILSIIGFLSLTYWLFLTSERVGLRCMAGRTLASHLIASAPLIALSGACIRAAREVPATGQDYWWGLLGLSLVGGIGLLVGLFWVCRTWRNSTPKITTEQRLAAPTACERALPLLCVLLLLFFLLAPFFDEATFVHIAQSTGPLAISWFALLLYLVGLSWITEQGEKRGIPFVAVIIIAIVIFQWVGWNDNHDVREVASEKRPADFETAFLEWHATRQTLAPGKPVPVFIVATQGGGIYAARHSATALARIQDECPTFGQYIFAISGVSGGSVGATVFASAINDLDPQLQAPTCAPTGASRYQDYVASALYRDFLSPTLWLWLLPEMIQVLLPLPRIDAYDRALGLEYGLEGTALDGSTFYSGGMLESWSVENAIPALFLNTARAGTGQQLYLSPLTLSTIAGADTRPGSLHEYRQDPFDMRVSTAAGLSARFPVVSSVARFDADVRNIDNEPLETTDSHVELFDHERLALVDGGFADNSGGETALRVFRRVATIVAEHDLDVRLEIVFIGDVSHRYADILRWMNSMSDLNEQADPRFLELLPNRGDGDDGAHILTPILTLNNARSDRSRLASSEADEINGLISDAISGVCERLFPEAGNEDPRRLECFELRRRTFAGRTIISYSEPTGTVPLGWMLSRLSDDRVAKLRLGAEFSYALCGALPDEQVDLMHAYGETLLAAYDRQQNACHMRQFGIKIGVALR